MKMPILLVAVLWVGALATVALVAGCPKPTGEAGAPPTASSAAPANAAVPAKAAPPSAPGASGAPTTSSADTASCPVLGTTMPKSQMIKLDYKGKTYYFCCQDCVTKFKANPQKYIDHPAKPLPLGQAMPM